jgi:hypothetical protein
MFLRLLFLRGLYPKKSHLLTPEWLIVFYCEGEQILNKWPVNVDICVKL